MAVGADGQLTAYFLAGTAESAGWMHDWLESRHSTGDGRSLSRALLADSITPPTGSAPARSAMVCSCNEVSQVAIETNLKVQGPLDGSAAEVKVCVERLKTQLKCGTTCGSCLPAVKALVRQSWADAVARQPVEQGTV
jgi:assimilatory nitrate reductase catalytic subunit